MNFTPMSATMSPADLVGLLDDVFSYFDELTERYELEKIKTIGDCYMAASGLPRPRIDHAQVPDPNGAGDDRVCRRYPRVPRTKVGVSRGYQFRVGGPRSHWAGRSLSMTFGVTS